MSKLRFLVDEESDTLLVTDGELYAQMTASVPLGAFSLSDFERLWPRYLKDTETELCCDLACFVETDHQGNRIEQDI